jgi:hypothetical protein
VLAVKKSTVGIRAPQKFWVGAEIYSLFPINHSSTGYEVENENLHGRNFAEPKYILLTSFVAPFLGNTVQTTKGCV